MIEVRDLTRYYGKRLVVDHASFKIAKGEIVGLLGPNGAGKTTTMRMMTGYLAPTSGQITVAGTDMLNDSLEARRHIGYLPESVPLYADMTVRGYLRFLAKLRGLTGERIRSRMDDVLGLCHLEEYADTLIGRLSKGYRQRTGIAQAIIHDPEVLVLDEPTVGIDPLQVSDTRQLIRDLGRTHTVVLSTHILPEVGMTCRRVIIIHEGKIVAQDRIENLSALTAGVRRVRLEVSGPANRIQDRLRAVPGVSRVTVAEDSRFLVEYPSGTDLRGQISEAVSQGGFTLLSFEPVSLSLEDVFLKLTAEEERPE